jgi:hypothetical protein
MKRTSFFTLLSLFAASALVPQMVSAQDNSRFRQIVKKVQEAQADTIEAPKSILPEIDSTYFIVRDVDEIINSLGEPDFERTPINKVFGPWIFSGYRAIPKVKPFKPEQPFAIDGLTVLTNDSTETPFDELLERAEAVEGLDSVPFVEKVIESVSEEIPAKPLDIDVLHPEIAPKWLRDALTSYRIQEDFMYSTMVTDPSTIEKAYWDLPVPPRLPEDDVSFEAYIKKLDLPDIDPEKAVLAEDDGRRIHWLHNVNTMLQFSQAYVSENWYQGGNNHLSLLFGFNWNVQLNQVYHPNLLFQSNLSYKLGLNSTPQDEVHAYSISEDVLQYNLNAGVKAFQKWFYSFNTTFKTQILRNYEKNSTVRKASFLSPGDFNLGLGMAYSTQNKKKTFQLTATISPISYNLKTCISDKINHEQFNIKPDRKSHSEIGSNGEVNMNWNIMWNINYKSRLFLFSDYKYFLSDWEHTLSFAINKFLSTQIYVHMRYDTSAESNTSWKKFMLREVLSFGLAYTFSTKP